MINTSLLITALVMFLVNILMHFTCRKWRRIANGWEESMGSWKAIAATWEQSYQLVSSERERNARGWRDSTCDLLRLTKEFMFISKILTEDQKLLFTQWLEQQRFPKSKAFTIWTE